MKLPIKWNIDWDHERQVAFRLIAFTLGVMLGAILVSGCGFYGNALDLYETDQGGAAGIVIEGGAIPYGGGSIVSAYASKDCNCTVTASKDSGVEIISLEDLVLEDLLQ